MPSARGFQAGEKEPNKNALLKRVAELEEASQNPDPKPELAPLLGKVDAALESVDAAVEQAGGVLEKLGKIAGAAGLALTTVAPFVAKLLGL